MSNERPLKLDMTFKEALQMIAKRGKPSGGKVASGKPKAPKGGKPIAKKASSRVQLSKVK